MTKGQFSALLTALLESEPDDSAVRAAFTAAGLGELPDDVSGIILRTGAAISALTLAVEKPGSHKRADLWALGTLAGVAAGPEPEGKKVDLVNLLEISLQQLAAGVTPDGLTQTIEAAEAKAAAKAEREKAAQEKAEAEAAIAEAKEEADEAGDEAIVAEADETPATVATAAEKPEESHTATQGRSTSVEAESEPETGIITATETVEMAPATAAKPQARGDDGEAIGEAVAERPKLPDPEPVQEATEAAKVPRGSTLATSAPAQPIVQIAVPAGAFSPQAPNTPAGALAAHRSSNSTDPRIRAESAIQGILEQVTAIRKYAATLPEGDAKAYVMQGADSLITWSASVADGMKGGQI